jgi:hypothetical protein
VLVPGSPNGENKADCTFEVIFKDLKKVTGATITADSKIVVEYTAELNENAVIGYVGNPNEMQLEYSNNPNWEGTGDEGEGGEGGEGDDDDDEEEDDEKGPTGKTPWDKVIVFTYTVSADKIHENPAYDAEKDEDNVPDMLRKRAICS